MQFVLSLVISDTANSFDQNTVASQQFDWDVVPRIGETISLEAGDFNQSFRVKEVRYELRMGLQEIEVIAEELRPLAGASSDFLNQLSEDGWKV